MHLEPTPPDEWESWEDLHEWLVATKAEHVHDTIRGQFDEGEVSFNEIRGAVNGLAGYATATHLCRTIWENYVDDGVGLVAEDRRYDLTDVPSGVGDRVRYHQILHMAVAEAEGESFRSHVEWEGDEHCWLLFKPDDG